MARKVLYLLKIAFTDFSKAQTVCPQGLPIAKLAKEAVNKFA